METTVTEQRRMSKLDQLLLDEELAARTEIKDREAAITVIKKSLSKEKDKLTSAVAYHEELLASLIERNESPLP